VIEVKDISKSYGSVCALNDVNLKIAAGEIVGLLGPNGAGKTTIIKVLTGYLQPDSGEAIVDGLNVLENPLDVQAQIGYLPENAPLYPEQTVQSYLKMMADLRYIPDEDQPASISEAVRSVGLEEYLTRPIGQLSKGFRQRVGLAQAILHKPRLLILDEPTVGLDPTQIVEIRRLIKRLAQNSTVLFSTHILPEVEALCDRVIILMNGEVKADACLDELASTANVVLVLEKDVPGAATILKGLSGVTQVEEFQTEDRYPAYKIAAKDEVDINLDVYQLAAKNKWQLRELRRDVRTLELVFNELAVAE
jgi:ABC-2 type transport system ATP-binding protein